MCYNRISDKYIKTKMVDKKKKEGYMHRIKIKKIYEGIYLREKVEYIELERFVGILARLIEKYAEKIELNQMK